MARGTIDPEPLAGAAIGSVGSALMADIGSGGAPRFVPPPPPPLGGGGTTP
ncbi:MAG: hypothetical protein WCQ21_26885 [Verrucomicrobiota bacterium]